MLQQQGPRLSLKVNAKQLSREELQAKLAKKLEELRTKKGAGAAAAKAWQQSQVRARAEGAGAGRAAGPKGEDAGKRAGHRGADGGDDAALGNGRAAGAKRKRAADGEEETGEGEGALAYSKVQVGDGKQKKRHMSKTAALQKAEEEHKRLQELQGTEEGKVGAVLVLWECFAGAPLSNRP